MGLSLDLLDMSENLINPLNVCTFCGAKIRHLDLSGNKLTSLNAAHFDPLATTLERLYLDRNRHLIDPPSSLTALLQPLRRLRHLSVADLRLNKTLPDSVFDSLHHLTFLNLSHNELQELSNRLLSGMVNTLETLDISHNELAFFDSSTLQIISQMKHLERIHLQSNPFSCYRCHILPFIDWLNSNPAAAPYWNVCGKPQQQQLVGIKKIYNNDDNDDDGVDNSEWLTANCARCENPSSLKGRYLHEHGKVLNS